MAATTISRATITDDSGSGTDGTIINSAWVGSAIYDKIDAIFTGVDTTFEGSTNGARSLRIQNTNAGSSSAAILYVGNDTAVDLCNLVVRSSTCTPGAFSLPSGVELFSSGAGGLLLGATNAAGPLRFFSGGSAERGRFTASGHFALTELGANPGTSDLAADAAIAVYTKSDKFVIAYNNGGTMTYITLDLDGSDTTWAHSTSAP